MTIKLKRILVFSMFLWLQSLGLQAQQKETVSLDPKQLQEMIQNTISKAYAASVLIDDYDTVAKVRKNAAFSGVVVSKDGIILTAAHVGMPGRAYVIIFPDGKEYMAKGLGRIQRFDAAVLKITQKGDWPFAELGWSSSLKTNEPCVSIAYPASFRPRMSVVRFGYVANVSDPGRGMIRTTCLMEPGDSGGPVFDLYGRVVGLHSNIRLELENNFEIPVDVYRKYWTALMKPEDYRTLPSEDKVPADPLFEKRMNYPSIAGIQPQLLTHEAKMDGFTVRLSNTPDSTVALGTLLKITGLTKGDVHKKIYIISKNSLVKDGVLASFSNGSSEKPKIIYTDERKDLVLMQLDTKGKLNGVDVFAGNKKAFTFSELGELVISPNPTNEGEIGVLGSLRFNLPGMYSAGYFGSNIEIKDGRAWIQMVQENSPASSAGIKVGDEIISLGGVKIESPEMFTKEIQKNKPDEVVKIIYKRGTSEQTIDVKLGKRPARTSTHVAERFLDGKSVRRDGFENAFVHDSKIKPSECGGPVFDIYGNFLGINMARYSRTSSIAVAAAEISSFLEQAFARQSLKTDTK